MKMQKFIFFIFFNLLLLNSYKLFAEDSLTVKQQLDRIMEEVKDLNKAVFNKSFNKNELSSLEANNDAERFTSIDIRIYDLEKDIKNLTLQFEEILFKLDDLSSEMNSLEDRLITKMDSIQPNLENSNILLDNQTNNELSDLKEENTLGKLVISDDNQNLKNLDSQNIIDEDETNLNEQQQKLDKLSPEEQLQLALDQMMKKNYDISKEILENFIISFSDNQLSGSAHFWLGKIYLFESNYRKAAIIFGEGVQKFPKSIKAAEMYYELSKSLKEMKKFKEACKTLAILDEKYEGNKYSKDPEKIREVLNCKNQD